MRVKNYKILIFSLIIMLFACKDALKEDFYGPENVPLMNRVFASYVPLKDWYGKEIGYDLSEAGTDLFTWGQEHKSKEMMTYAPEYGPENPRLCILWASLYKAIESCNSTLSYLKKGDEDISGEDNLKLQAEVRFLRAHYNWLIVETWGGVHLTVEPTIKPEYTANISSVDDFYEKIFEDLNFSVANLSFNDNALDQEYGRITKLAALAFRARMNLTRGNYLQALNDADAVIFEAEKNQGLKLVNNYNDLWEVENSEDNSEIIWALNYSTSIYSTMNIDYQSVLNFCNTNTGIYPIESYNGNENVNNGGGGFWGQLYFTMEYDKIPGMERNSYNRPYRRYIPTRYFVDLFKDNDQRYKGTFRFVFRANLPNDSRIPKWPAFDSSKNEKFIPVGSNEGEKIFEPNEEPFKGDTAILLTNKEIADDLLVTKDNYKIHKYGHYIVLDRDMLYEEDGTPVTTKTKVGSINLDRQIYLGLKKLTDPTIKSGRGVEGSTRSGRDAMIIRLSEMYLIAAEAIFSSIQPIEGVKGNAYNYLKILADARDINGDGVQLLKDYGIISPADLTTTFFLEERAREFAAEQLRWFDLKRVHNNIESFNMVNWIKSKNPDTKLMQEYHMKRPIPQTQIDAMRNSKIYNDLNAPYNER